jgi:hypothetical protein
MKYRKIKQYIARPCRPARTAIANLVMLICILSSNTISANIDDDIDQDDGTMSSEFPHIPEPMVFDLVRPLGTTKGELEINTLALHEINGQVEWAPEIEYAVMDGLALEFELPFENTTIQDYKVAAQGTLRKGSNHNFIHGWQVIGRYLREESSYSADMLYIAGYRFNSRWSTLNMIGLRGEELVKHTKVLGLANLNVFYTLDENMALGLELNNEFNHKNWHFALTPQLHANLTDNFSLQMGAGPAKFHGKHTRWTVGGRLIYTF